jgi:hypothetical protein
MNIRRQARDHVRGLERLGYHVTIQAINPDTSCHRGRSVARNGPALLT